MKQEQHIVLPTPIRSSVFGVPLEELMGHDGEKGSIPRVLKDSIQDLLSSGECRALLFCLNLLNIHRVERGRDF